MADGRQMVRKREDEALIKAKNLAEAAGQKALNLRKRAWKEATKEARNWRTTGKLKPAEISDGSGVLKRLRRF